MSSFTTLAFDIQERIETIPDLKGHVFVGSALEPSMDAEITRRLTKAGGKAVIVQFLRANNTKRQKVKARFASSFVIQLYHQPLITRKDAVKADALAEQIAELLHGWWPETIPSNGLWWCDVSDIVRPPDRNDLFLITLDAPRTST